MANIFNSDLADECALISKTLLLALTTIVSLIAGILWSQWLLQHVFSSQIVAMFVIAAVCFSIAAVSMIDEIKSETLNQISFRTLTSMLVLSTLLIIIFLSPKM